jgi:transposase
MQSTGRETEFGEIVPQGATNAKRLIAIVEGVSSVLPDDARATLLVLIETKTRLDGHSYGVVG